MSELKVRTVSWLLRQISAAIDSNPILHGVILEAEVSNFHAHSSGHWYFSLKDERSRIDATMWENDNLLVNFLPKDGDKIRVLGNVTVYPVQGKIQFTVRKMARAGSGDLKALFDALYRKLNEEGLFDSAYKKPIPKYPMNIALVTGSATHARADVYNTLGRRWPIAHVQEYPSLVQGEAAPASLINALQKADQGGHDVILLCRGGGSAEDLWCFNDEALARTIHAMITPVITGVGHEPDWTMVDYVADLRAPTPTGAAERATPDIREVHRLIENSRDQMIHSMDLRMEQERSVLKRLSDSRSFRDPFRMIADKRMYKDMLEQQFLRQLHTGSIRTRQMLNEQQNTILALVRERMSDEAIRLKESLRSIDNAVRNRLQEEQKGLAQTAGLLDAYSPLKVLERGYSIVSNANGVIRSAQEVRTGDKIRVRLHQGSLTANVTETEES